MERTEADTSGDTGIGEATTRLRKWEREYRNLYASWEKRGEMIELAIERLEREGCGPALIADLKKSVGQL